MKRSASLLLLLAASYPAIGHAQDTRFSVYGSLGFNWQQDGDIRASGFDTEAEYDVGFTGLYGGSYDVTPTPLGIVRAELEGFYRENELDRFQGNASGDLEVDSYGLMANLVFSATELDWHLTPYIGGGVGWARVDVDLDTSTFSTSREEDVFAYQGFVGLEYPVTPKIGIFTDLRYFGTEDIEFRSVGPQRVDVPYENVSLSFGARYRF